jgi:hypothetical protein
MLSWDDYTDDNHFYNTGNCFRTREEALEAHEKMMQALKGNVIVLPDDGYEYWFPGLGMPKPEKKPDGCKVVSERNNSFATCHPKYWDENAYRWPKKERSAT